MVEQARSQGRLRTSESVGGKDNRLIDRNHRARSNSRLLLTDARREKQTKLHRLRFSYIPECSQRKRTKGVACSQDIRRLLQYSICSFILLIVILRRRHILVALFNSISLRHADILKRERESTRFFNGVVIS